jgi:diguanylate cyclase (GGDEF)-like protein
MQSRAERFEVNSVLFNRFKLSMSSRLSLVWDGVTLVAVVSIAALFAYQYDLFPRSSRVPARAIDANEALLLAAIFACGLLMIFSRLLMSQRELSRRIKAEQRARESAHRDSLTGLPNKRKFDKELRTAINAPLPSGGAHALFSLDLNNFKRVNGVYGRGVGDEVLISAAARIQRAVRDGDLVARIGGDEFAIISCQLGGTEEAATIALRVIKEFEQPITVGSTQHQIGVGIGIALIPRDGHDADEAVRKADIALYRAKAGPDSASCFFEAAMDAHIRERELIERELRLAIRDHAIQPFFQPLIDLRTKRIMGFEALARWTHPILGEAPPDRFIPIAESCGLLAPLTEHLLRCAARAAYAWPEEIGLSFNISPLQLKDPTLAFRILSILQEERLSPTRLEIEITESAFVQDLAGARRVLAVLSEAGVRIALDDFGTGYSSLYHLRNLKIDTLKIDRSFIDNMESDREAAAFVRALVGLGHGLGLTVTAEGVEQPEQARLLSEQGCETGQGYLFGRAMSARDTIDFIAFQGKGAVARVARAG